MTEASAQDAFGLLHEFLREDPYYLASSHAYGDSGDAGLTRALALFLERPELGFVWLSYESKANGPRTPDRGPRTIKRPQSTPVAVSVVSFAISTSLGTIVAKLDDVFVTPRRQGHGIGSAHLAHLKAELVRLGIGRIDTSVHSANLEARRFYERLGFSSLHEERLACRL